MLLELDCGNTLIKWRLLDRHGRVRDRDMSPDLVDLQCLLGGQEREIHACRLVSVRSEEETQLVVDQLTSWLRLHPLLAKPSRELAGVSNGYLEHDRLGMDRWLAAVAAYARFQSAVLVVDLGTAVTVDYVTVEGRHLGGFIAPGSRLLRSALKRHTRLIRYGDQPLLPGPEVPGKSTAEAVETGCNMMLLGFLREQMACACRVLGDDMQIILTGGDAEFYAQALGGSVQVVGDLVFEGLSLACPVES